MTRLSRIGIATAAAAFAVSGLSACGSSDSSSAAPTSTSSASEDAAPSSEAPESASESTSPDDAAPAAEPVVLTIKDFAYSDVGTVAPGTEITVKNDDDAAHTVTAEGKGDFDVILQPGKSATFKAPSEPGKYAYTCTYHANMTGTLVVG